MARLMLLAMLAACGVDEVSEQEIGGGPRGDVCFLSEYVPCWMPTCREIDCVAPRYWCCDYGEIGQPLGCGYIVDNTSCGLSIPV